MFVLIMMSLRVRDTYKLLITLVVFVYSCDKQSLGCHSTYEYYQLSMAQKQKFIYGRYASLIIAVTDSSGNESVKMTGGTVDNSMYLNEFDNITGQCDDYKYAEFLRRIYVSTDTSHTFSVSFFTQDHVGYIGSKGYTRNPALNSFRFVIDTLAFYLPEGALQNDFNKRDFLVSIGKDTLTASMKGYFLTKLTWTKRRLVWEFK